MITRCAQLTVFVKWMCNDCVCPNEYSIHNANLILSQHGCIITNWLNYNGYNGIFIPFTLIDFITRFICGAPANFSFFFCFFQICSYLFYFILFFRLFVWICDHVIREIFRDKNCGINWWWTIGFESVSFWRIYWKLLLTTKQ